MIARLWSARATSPNAQAYRTHFFEHVLPELKKFDGYAAATLLTRELDGSQEIVVQTFWRSLAHIEAFAGTDSEAAVVAPAAEKLFTSFDRRVRHYFVDQSDQCGSVSVIHPRA